MSESLEIDFEEIGVLEILTATTTYITNNYDVNLRQAQLLTPVVLEYCSNRALVYLTKSDGKVIKTITTAIREIKPPTGEEE